MGDMDAVMGVLEEYILTYGDDAYERLVHRANDRVLKKNLKAGNNKVLIADCVRMAARMARKEMNNFNKQKGGF